MFELQFKGDKVEEIDKIVKEFNARPLLPIVEKNKAKFFGYDFMGDIIDIFYKPQKNTTLFILYQYPKNGSDKETYKIGLEKLLNELSLLK